MKIYAIYQSKWAILLGIWALSIGCEKIHTSAEATKRFRYNDSLKSLASAFSNETWPGDQSAKKKRIIELIVLNLKLDIREELQIRLYKHQLNEIELENKQVPLIILTKKWQSLTDQTGLNSHGELVPAAEIDFEPYEIINPFEVR